MIAQYQQLGCVKYNFYYFLGKMLLFLQPDRDLPNTLPHTEKHLLLNDKNSICYYESDRNDLSNYSQPKPNSSLCTQNNTQ